MRHAAILPLAAAVLFAWGCKSEETPIARLTVPRPEVTLPHGERVLFELRFQGLADMPADAGKPIVFVHLLDAAGDVVRTFDHPLAARIEKGKETVDTFALFQSGIGPALPAGAYRLTVGLYDGGERRWGLETSAEEIERQEYAVARVRVPAGAADTPRFAFTPEWQAVEAGEDKQMVARRWLSGDGAIEVQALAVPASLWLTLRIPSAEPPMRIMLEEGSRVPGVRVDTNCSGFSATVTGEGFHEVTVPVATVPCRIRFDANFTAMGRDPGRKFSVALEQLTWQPGAAAGAAPAPAEVAASPAPPATPESSPADPTAATPAP
jgi:hypothetical protein